MGKYQWIDEEVIIDFDIPLPIKELISEIEIYDLEDRLMEYVCACDWLDAFAKGWIDDGLTQSQYNKLCYKYR